MMRGRRQSNIRPVRGITADTVRALLGLRHAGSDCAYLPLERKRLVDQAKGTAPAPCIDLADVPATLRADCDAFPQGGSIKWQGVGDHRARPTHKLVPDMDDTFWTAEPPRLLTVLRCMPLTPSVAQPAPLGCDDEARSAGPMEPTAPAIPATPSPAKTDNGRAFASKSITGGAERTFRAVIGKELSARREHDRIDQAGPDQGKPEGRTDRDNRKTGRVSGSARPRTAARSACQDAERIAAAPVLNPQRIDLIRDIAARLEARKAPAPRPVVGPRIERKAALPMAGDPIARRREAIESAIRFLKSRYILVTITDRNAMIRKYRVTGKREAMLAEQVIEYAVSLGMGEQG